MVALQIQLQDEKRSKQSECSFSAFMWVFSSSKSFVNIKQLIPLEILRVGEVNVSINVDEQLLLLVSLSLSGCASKAWKPLYINEAFSFMSPPVYEGVAEMSNHSAFLSTFEELKSFAGSSF